MHTTSAGCLKNPSHFQKRRGVGGAALIFKQTLMSSLIILPLAMPRKVGFVCSPINVALKLGSSKIRSFTIL